VTRVGYDLLVLDYGGVCTMSHRELVGAAVQADRFNAERPECLTLVLAVQALGVRVAVLSNEIDRAWVERSTLLSRVDHVLACSDNRILKPDRRAYQRALLVTGCAADRTLFVDDEVDNVRGAQGAGLDAMLFDTSDPVASWSAIDAAIRRA
jgi:putative hydrolase of the HAD superfamily